MNELKLFLGVIGFLRKFINECTILTTTVSDLFEKSKRFMSDDLRGNNFRNFPEADTLFLPKFLKPFIYIL